MERPATANACADCATCALRRGAFADGLDATDLARLDRAKVSHSYGRGQTLFFEGNPCTGVFCLQNAVVRIVKTAPHGRRHVLGLAGPGDLLGLEAAVTGSAFGYGADVLAEGLVCQVERADIARLVEMYPSFQRAAMQQLAADVRHGHTERAQLVGGEVAERTAHVVLSLATRFGERVDGRLHLGLDVRRSDLADMVGAAEETVIRHLTDLRHRGVISTSPGAIVVEDPDRLAKLARFSPPLSR
jgi:CRP/FNR family transcriptional regulator